ncbi:hypothetical protein J132_06720 [Termitomyces sp. J132]|nr:hypothetical protein J132_06720 [Termitomyces sp. J132]
MPSPPDFYGMLQHAAIIGLCNTVAAFSSTPADHARYLGSIGWNFVDQADFPLLANQKGLYNALSTTLDVLNHHAATDSAAVNSIFVFADAIIKTEDNHHELQHQCEAATKQCCKHEDHDIEMLTSHLNLLAYCFDTLNLFLSSLQSELDSKSKPKKIKITPSVGSFSPSLFPSLILILPIALANYKPSRKTALLLLGQIDTLFEAHSVIDGHNLAPLKDLKKQRDVVELAVEQQLHLLDTTLQMYKLIVAHLSHLDKALSPINIDLASSLLTTLNISFEVYFFSLPLPKDSNVEPANPLAAEPQNSLELLVTPAL